jgi:hypothetical protein
VATLEQLRQIFGGDSDADTIDRASKELGLAPVEIANELGFGSSGGKNTQRMSASVDRYQAGLYGTGEALTGAVGLAGASQYLGQRRRSNEIEADIASGRAREMGAVDSFSDVHGLRDFGDYAVGLGIQSLPYMGEAVVGGMTGGLAASRLGLTGASAINAARATGAAVASYPSSVGDILQSQREQPGGQTDLLSAAALGVPYAAANVVGVEGALARGQLFRNSIGALDNLRGIRGGLARAGATAGQTALSEGASETFQEGMNQFGRMAVDPSETFFNPAANERFLESAIGGATLGGITGGAGGGWRRSATYTNVPTNVLPDGAPIEPGYVPPESLTNTPLTDLPGFASQPQDPLQSSININPNAAIAPVASGNVAATPPSNSPAKSAGKQPTEAPVTPEERQAANEMYRTESVVDDGTEEGHWRVFGKDYFKRSELHKALDKQAVEDRGRDPGLAEFEKVLNAEGPAFLRPAKLQELGSQLYGSTPEKTAYNLDMAIKGGHKEADRLAATYEKLTGKESPAWKASQEPKPTKQPEKKPEAKPAPAPAATQPKVEAPVQKFEEDDVEGMARATLMKLFNGNEANVEIALADLRGDKPAKIQEDYGVSDSQVRKIRGRLAPKALELAARQAGVPLEKLAAAFAKKDAIKEVAGEELVTEEAPTREVTDSDERTLATVADEELTAEQQDSDIMNTAGMTVSTNTGSQLGDASERNNSRAKLEQAKGNLMSKLLTPADLNNLWEQANKAEDEKLMLAVEREVMRRNRAGELSMADLEALAAPESEDEAPVLPTRQKNADATKQAAAPAAPKQAARAKEPKGKVGSAWDKVVREVAKAKVELPAWDSLTPEQKIKATDKFALNGKLSMHEIQSVLGPKGKITPTLAPKLDTKSAETIAKVQERIATPSTGKVLRSKAASTVTKEATGADFMAKLNEAAAKKKSAPVVDKYEGDAPKARPRLVDALKSRMAQEPVIDLRKRRSVLNSLLKCLG